MSKRVVCVEIDLDELPKAIAESARLVLAAHGYVLAKYGTRTEYDLGVASILSTRDSERALDEIGRNAAAPLALAEVHAREIDTDAIERLLVDYLDDRVGSLQRHALAEDIARICRSNPRT